MCRVRPGLVGHVTAGALSTCTARPSCGASAPGRSGAWILVALALVLAAAPAAAESSKEEARARFERAVKLYESGDYFASLAEFEAVHRAVPHFSVLFNIAVVQKKLFRYSDSLETFRRYLEEGGTQVSAERRAEVEREVAEIRTLVGELWVRVEGEPAEIELDGERIGVSPLSRPLLVRPGMHRLRATRPGGDLATADLEVISGEKRTVDLAPVAPARPLATLELSALPAKAVLSLDGRALGRGPWKGELAPGGYRLRATLEGFAPAEQEIALAAGQQRSLVLELSRLPAPPPTVAWYLRWYTWTVAGVVGVGVALGFFLLTPRVDVRVNM